MKTGSLLTTGAMIIVLLLIAKLAKPLEQKIFVNTTPTPTMVNHGIEEESYIHEINSYRIQHGLTPLAVNDKLCQYAQTRLQEIHLNYSHEGFYKSRESLCPNCYMGENIDMGPSNDFAHNWESSPEHRDNILNKFITQTCIRADYYDGNNYAVEELSSDIR